MSSTSHQSYASKIGNAQSMLLAIQEFPAYVAPIPTASPAALDASITSIQTLENTLNDAQTAYHVKVQDRQNVFDTNSNAIDKLLAPIRTFVEAITSDTDAQYIELNRLIKRIRGAAPKKSTNAINVSAAKKSQVEMTFNSRQHDFGLIINILESLSVPYTPPNADISIPNLIIVKDAAFSSTSKVETAQGVLKELTTKRLDSFKNLTAQCQSIKKFVKAQYGLHSTEYDRIKSLKI
jgi:hypothetical protein